MHTRRRQFERLRGVLSDADEPLTAREIMSMLDEHGADATVESTHQIATILGRGADRGEIEVLRGNPYRYRLNT
jgi:predicted Zn-ribbon and HTH transcriptional regulator